MGGAGVRGVAYLTRALCLFALAYAIILFVIVFFFILAHFFVGLENAMYRFYNIKCLRYLLLLALAATHNLCLFVVLASYLLYWLILQTALTNRQKILPVNANTTDQ